MMKNKSACITCPFAVQSMLKGSQCEHCIHNNVETMMIVGEYTAKTVDRIVERIKEFAQKLLKNPIK
ncbi:hypothetical protein [Ruminococcus sp. HUN007]|uniref:hypothetical protein n=1 Tax=Ruminococcus sp. HUN007 TaxID=1514668 RepID=UPI0005D290B9|nr:hypothetical protein [Ruminococcus sp. HUN007]